MLTSCGLIGAQLNVVIHTHLDEFSSKQQALQSWCSLLYKQFRTCLLQFSPISYSFPSYLFDRRIKSIDGVKSDVRELNFRLSVKSWANLKKSPTRVRKRERRFNSNKSNSTVLCCTLFCLPFGRIKRLNGWIAYEINPVCEEKSMVRMSPCSRIEVLCFTSHTFTPGVVVVRMEYKKLIFEIAIRHV